MRLASYLVHQYVKTRNCDRVGGIDLHVELSVVELDDEAIWKDGGITSEGVGVQQ